MRQKKEAYSKAAQALSFCEKNEVYGRVQRTGCADQKREEKVLLHENSKEKRSSAIMGLRGFGNQKQKDEHQNLV